MTYNHRCAEEKEKKKGEGHIIVDKGKSNEGKKEDIDREEIGKIQNK